MKPILARVGRVLLVMCSVLVLALHALPPAAHATEVEIRVATAYAADNFHTLNLQQYADDVAKATGGRVMFRIHPAGTLIKPAEIYSGVRSGKAEGGEVIMSSLANEHPLFGIDTLPFIVSGYEDARRLWETSRPGVEKVMRERGLQLLYAVPWPPQNLYARTPINTVLDFRGQRMRAYSPATVRISELVGAKPVTIQVVDLSKAIEEEKLDLMLTSAWTGVETKAWTKLRYYYKVNSWFPKNIVFIQKAIFDKLDADTQRKLFEAARAAEVRGWKLSQSTNQDYENQLAINKISISTMDPFIRISMDRIGERLAREWLKTAGPEELKILLKYTTDRSMK